MTRSRSKKTSFTNSRKLKMIFSKFFVLATFQISEARFDMAWEEPDVFIPQEDMLLTTNLQVLEAKDWHNHDDCGTYLRLVFNF